jgi:hypothetical protein
VFEKQPGSACDVDLNTIFLLSFLPEMQTLTERQYFEFRMMIMNALNKVKYQIPMNTDINSHWSASYVSPCDSYD